ncbi:acetyl-CoA carboxylase biotin carboxylase subunit family protein [Streptomyces sp. UNOC14_S4]|uniref:ATP-grasp domain-containing protein n=1 Tax=Streptomyces sp. UNOC14_S4 TaxID=2872340 RepID=UPI001E46B100|nr:ATP-grasp domain-containing protein [Streptomyces sp. UNOC14_S4]MCC3768879.1 ATP-grasp domain-containing protein [Streptomyces sp. UNOC14_S4]
MERIAIVGSRTDMARHAKELGLEVVLVHSPGSRPDRVRQYVDLMIECPVADAEAVLDVLAPLHRERPFRRVLAPGEDAVLTAAVVSEKLGIPGNSVETVVAIKNKVLTRQAMDRVGISPVLHRTVASEAELLAFLAEVNGKIILKPIDSTGSLSTLPIEDAEQARRAWGLYVADGHTEGLVEEFLEGPEVTLESFSVAGKHHPVGIDEYLKHPDQVVEIGDLFPGRVSEENRNEMVRLTSALLDAVGLLEGPSHTEFILTDKGPRVLETHCRIGGGAINELVKRAYGVDLSRLQVSVPLGLETFTPHALDSGKGAAMIFFMPKPGRVTRISGLDALETLGVPVHRMPVEKAWTGLVGLDPIRHAEVGVNLCLEVGEIAHPVRNNWELLMGFVIANGEDADRAAARAEEVMAAITIETEPIETEPVDGIPA